MDVLAAALCELYSFHGVWTCNCEACCFVNYDTAPRLTLSITICGCVE